MARHKQPIDWMKEIDGSIAVDDYLFDSQPSSHSTQSTAAGSDQSNESTDGFAYNATEIAELCRLDLNWLAGLATPDIFQFKYPTVLLGAWQLLTTCAVKVRDFSQIALGIPRGHGKTTLVKLFVLWLILFTKKKFILVISSTSDLAENVISDIADMLSEPNVKAVFGDWKASIESDRLNLKKFNFRGRSITLACIGAQGSMRGLNINNDRPDVMIFEDIQTREDAESQQVSDAILRWMIGTAMKAKSPHGCLFVFCANMYPGPNSILKKLKKAKGWIKFIAGAILANGEALWEQLRSREELLTEFENDIDMGHPEIFFSEVLNDTEAGINTKTDLSKLKAWPWQSFEKPQGKFIVIDPSGNKTNSDDVAIGYFEVYDGVPALRKMVEEPLSPGNTIRKALLMALENGVLTIAAESNGYQGTLLYWFDVVATQLGIQGLNFVEVFTGIKSKNSRISTMLKSLTANEIILHNDVKPHIINQIKNWNPMKINNVDNGLDLLTYSQKVIELYGPMLSTDNDFTDLEAMQAHVVANNTAF